jgi:WD repeat-containing protein 7
MHKAELRSAARALFESALGRMTDEEVTAFTEEWQHQRKLFFLLGLCALFDQAMRIVPCLQPDSLKEAPFAAAALMVTGNIAIARYSLLSTVYVRLNTRNAYFINPSQVSHRYFQVRSTVHA